MQQSEKWSKEKCLQGFKMDQSKKRGKEDTPGLWRNEEQQQSTCIKDWMSWLVAWKAEPRSFQKHIIRQWRESWKGKGPTECRPEWNLMTHTYTHISTPGIQRHPKVMQNGEKQLPCIRKQNNIWFLISDLGFKRTMAWGFQNIFHQLIFKRCCLTNAILVQQ